MEQLAEVSALAMPFDAGRHDEALDAAHDLARRLESVENASDIVEVWAAQTLVYRMRGQPELSAPWLPEQQRLARDTGDPQT